jgi:hypothetical protein
MNWIDFSKEKPKREPNRWILLWTPDGPDVLWIGAKLDFAKVESEITHWAEIEPPGNPPTPDLFEEWFRTVGVFIFDNPNGKYALARAAYDKGWDAAIRWKEKNFDGSTQ